LIIFCLYYFTYFNTTWEIPDSLHRFISDAFDIRQAGDYGPVGSVRKEKARVLIEQSKEFIEVVERYLRKEGCEL